MKSGFYSNFAVGVLLAFAPIAGMSQQSAAPPPAAPTNAVANPEQESAALSEAPVTAVSSEKPLPASVKASGPTAEVIRLANSGVEQSVLLAYVTNSTSTFNLGAEEIIYLNDIGVPSPVVTAMIQHDQTLKTNLAIAANTPVQPQPGTQEPPPAMPNEPPPPVEGQEPVPAPVEAPLTPPEASSDFYGTLAPYGSWVNVDGYGVCWQPTAVVVNPGWQPYCDGGHWIYTDCGWYWSSDYSWGWAPFHYGRWFRHHHLGWCWAPDTVWGPSWVSWRHSDAYCGWAPLPPGCAFTVGIGLTFHGRHVYDGDDCGLDHRHYCFVSWHDFHDHHLHAHTLPRDQAARAFNHSAVANRFTTRNNMVVNQGIPATRVASATQAPLHPVALQTTSAARAVNGRSESFDPNHRTLTVYRPNIRPTGTVAQNTRTGTAPTSALEKAPWQPVATPAQHQPGPGQPQWAGGGQVHSGAHLVPPGFNGQPTSIPPVSSGAHLTPGSPTGQPLVRGGSYVQPVPGQSVPRTPVSQQNPTTITLKGPQSPSSSRPVWNPYAQNPTPWQYSTPNYQGTVRTAPQTAMNVPQVPAQAQGSYSGQNNQGFNYQPNTVPNYPAPGYQAPNRSAPVEVPRYNSYPQSRPYSPPVANNSHQGYYQQAPASTYQAPPAQHYSAPAPSAAPAHPSAPPQQQQSSRGDNSGGGGNGRGR